MIMVDVNILIYAEDSTSPCHQKAKAWWENILSQSERVCLTWSVIMEFIWISTHPGIFKRPLSLSLAIARVQSWLAQPCVQITGPTAKHWENLQEILQKGQAVGKLAMDAHLAVMAIEHGCTLYSTDRDFSRFPGLKWKNPLTIKRFPQKNQENKFRFFCG